MIIEFEPCTGIASTALTPFSTDTRMVVELNPCGCVTITGCNDEKGISQIFNVSMTEDGMLKVEGGCVFKTRL